MISKNLFYTFFPVSLDDLIFKEFESSMITDKYLAEINQREYLKFSSLSKKIQNRRAISDYVKKLNEINDVFLFVFDMNKNHLGNVTLRYNQNFNSIDISIRVNFKFRNMGHGKKIIRLLVEYLSNKFVGIFFTAGTDKNNLSMSKILFSNGFKLLNNNNKNEQNIYFELKK